MTISLKHLAYVVAAADLGSITRASAALDVSPPAISAAIKGFEQRYGIRLFVRNPARGLAVISSGRSFVTQARRLLEAERGFDNRARGIGQQLTGEIHVGCYFITAPFLLGQVVGRLASRHPNLKLTLHEGDLIQVVRNLKAGHSDIAVTYDIYLDGVVAFEPLFATTPHVIISERDPLAAKSVLSLRDLVDKPMVLLDLPATQDYFLNYFHSHGLVPDVQYRLRSFEMIRTLVGAGTGFFVRFSPASGDAFLSGQPACAPPPGGARSRPERLPGLSQGHAAYPRPRSVHEGDSRDPEPQASRAIREVALALSGERQPRGGITDHLLPTPRLAGPCPTARDAQTWRHE